MKKLNKKLLLLGGGRGNLGALKAAKELGVETIVVGMEGKYPCYKIADKYIYADICDKEYVLKIAQEENIDGALICCSDKALHTLGYVCDKMKLSGLSENASMISSNKLSMKKALADANINTAKFHIIRQNDDLAYCISNMKFPLIIKAVDLQGSKGIYISKDEQSLFNNYQKVLVDSHQSYCLVEEYIEGVEFGVQSFIANGEILFVLPHGDIIYNNGESNVPIGHYAPYNMNCFAKEELTNEVSKAIKAVGLDNCAVNVDLILKNNKPYIIELTGRVGANCLPEMVSHYYNIDYYKMIVALSLGDNPKDFFNNCLRDNYVVDTRMLFSTKSGIFDKVFYNNNLSFVNLFIEKGDEVRKFNNSNDCIGQILCEGNTFEDCEILINNFLSEMNIKLL